MLDKKLRSRLSWRCRRGMLELDLLLQDFLFYGIDKLTDTQIACFESLLTMTDPELYACLMGQADAPTDEFDEIITLIRHCHKDK